MDTEVIKWVEPRTSGGGSEKVKHSLRSIASGWQAVMQSARHYFKIAPGMRHREACMTTQPAAPSQNVMPVLAQNSSSASEPVRIFGEQTLKEFYTDATQRLKLHYEFAHRWLPAYVKSDPCRWFGCFVRGEVNDPDKFIQARWQLMEQELEFSAESASDQMTHIRRVSDLKMWVRLPEGSLGLMPNTDQSDARKIKVVPGSRYPIAIVQMPEPEYMTHAYFVGIVLVQEAANAKHGARIFTLERVEGDLIDGRLCEWHIEQRGDQSQTSHRNFGISVPATRQAFVEAINARVG